MGCSIPSVRLKLKEWHAYTSYNKNGRYYTLPGVPQFDENGLWKHKGIFFSKHGTLKNTVIHFIQCAPSGLTGHQIGERVGLCPRSFLHHFRDIPDIRREKHEGSYVYFSKDETIYTQQVGNRRDVLTQQMRPLSDEDTLLILVEIIKHHHFTVDDILRLPHIQARNISPLLLRDFFKRHDLEKKTPNAKPYV